MCGVLLDVLAPHVWKAGGVSHLRDALPFVAMFDKRADCRCMRIEPTADNWLVSKHVGVLAPVRHSARLLVAGLRWTRMSMNSWSRDRRYEFRTAPLKKSGILLLGPLGMTRRLGELSAAGSNNWPLGSRQAHSSSAIAPENVLPEKHTHGVPLRLSQSFLCAAQESQLHDL